MQKLSEGNAKKYWALGCQLKHRLLSHGHEPFY